MAAHDGGGGARWPAALASAAALGRENLDDGGGNPAGQMVMGIPTCDVSRLDNGLARTGGGGY
jgi:hypothetical protein